MLVCPIINVGRCLDQKSVGDRFILVTLFCKLAQLYKHAPKVQTESQEATEMRRHDMLIKMGLDGLERFDPGTLLSRAQYSAHLGSHSLTDVELARI
ncbi:MAG: hypothetical protein RL324_707 [Verrucomicrobiota bacterium]